MAKFRTKRILFVLLFIFIIITIYFVYNRFVSNREGLTWNKTKTITINGPNRYAVGDRIANLPDVNEEDCRKKCIDNKKCEAVVIGLSKSKGTLNRCQLVKNVNATNGAPSGYNTEFLTR